MTRHSLSSALALTVSVAALMAGAPAIAADAAAGAPAPTMTGAGAEGTDVSTIIVTAERNKAAAEAPSKASLEQTQPEAIISRQFIEQVTPETGDYTTAAAIAPSMSGITTNGGGIGDYNKSSLRGFQDGQYNLTYDGISFGDTNDPTHHPADYWPASTIGAVVVDRGPGAAGDLGQANFGGAIHMFSPEATDKFGVVQKVTYGSFNTVDLVTTLNTGTLSQLAGGKLLLSFDERQSDGELSHSGGDMANQLVKFVLPIGDRATFTLFGAHEYTRFNLADAGPGETFQQTLAYGKNFALNNIPTDEHYYKYNYEAKTTDFEYADLKGQLFPTVTAENQLYTYYYANKTTSVNDITGIVGATTTSPPNSSALPQTDIGGYDKLNEYRVWGDVVRVNKEWSFGTLKVGGIVESSSTNRHNLFEDLTLGVPDYKFTVKKYPNLAGPTNAKLQEDSKWLQYQIFADFEWNVTDKFKLSPGFKYVDFKRTVNAANENTLGGSRNQPLHEANTYTQPLYFLTANYKIRPDWSLYGQVATSFLIPSLSDLYATGASLQSLQPQKTISYQLGTVYTHGDITADADVYQIDATNLVAQCNIPDPTPTNSQATTKGFCNFGTARYNGVEGEVAYHFDIGLTLFVNGSLNSAKQLASAATNSVTQANPAQTLPNAPKWTDAAGVLYSHGPIHASLTYKQSGAYVASYDNLTVPGKNLANRLSGYDTIDASGAYDFGHYAVKLQVFNIADKRAITAFSGIQLYNINDSGLYSFQAGREILATLSAKF